MKSRLALLLALALILLMGPTTSDGESESRADCYLVLSYFPYPHYIYYCNPGGGSGKSW